MLQSRRLDDQQYEDIVERAKGRLPWLCPVWTDHNAHDPGITILELMAWYKESVQYQMDLMSPEIQRSLLALAGVELEGERAAECALDIPADFPSRPALSRLSTPEGVPFELEEPVEEKRACLDKLLIESGRRKKVDIAALISGQAAFQPFSFDGGKESALLLGFSEIPEKKLRLWFDVAAPSGTPRNPPDASSRPPRDLVWTFSGAGEVPPEEDGTWSMSWSGFVTFPEVPGWARGDEGLYWIRLSQKYAGCEERVRLQGVSATRVMAIQQESRARSYRFVVEPGKKREVRIGSAQAAGGEIAVFLRRTEGWTQLSEYRFNRSSGGLHLAVNAQGAAKDGSDNLLVVCMDPIHVHDLLFDAKGRPGERFPLHLEGVNVLSGSLGLMCLTLYPDGKVRPAEWRCVEDLALYGPRDRVFRYDRGRESLVFGDGRHGALVQPGTGAVMVTDIRLSLCSGGNIPANSGLRFESGGEGVPNFAASGGRGPETPEEGRARLLRRLRNTERCLSAEDYERLARETPGLRVLGARAIPDYDRSRPHQKVPARVSVVVLPAGENPQPTADERFLEAVSRRLDKCRSICVQAEAIPVRYVPFTARISLRCVSGINREEVQEAVEAFFAPAENRIGAPCRTDDVAALLQKLPGVLQVRRIDFRGLDQNSYSLQGGDLSVAPDAMLSLRRAEIEIV